MARHSGFREFILSAVFLTVFHPVTAFSEERAYTYYYEVYAGGIHAVETKLTMKFDDDDYNVFMEAGTRGWLKALAPWDGTFESAGAKKDKDFFPTFHKSVATWAGEEEINDFKYKDGNLVSFMIDEYDKEPDYPELDPKLTLNTTDILSAALKMMQNVGGGTPCDSKADIYDGKRRFEVSFKDRGEEIMPQSRYNGFAGTARVCEVEVTPKGGQWHNKPRGWLSIQEQGRQLGSLPIVWLAKMDNHGYAIPVKVQVKTEYGTLMMHLKP